MACSIISSVRATPHPARPHKGGGCANAIDSTQMPQPLRPLERAAFLRNRHREERSDAAIQELQGALRQAARRGGRLIARARAAHFERARTKSEAGRPSHWTSAITRGKPISGPLARLVSMLGVKPGSSPATSLHVIPLPSALCVERGMDGRRIEAQDLGRPGFRQGLPRRGRLIASSEKAFRRAAKPTQDLKHDSAGDGALRRHGPERAHADGYGRRGLEWRVDLGGKLIQRQLSSSQGRVRTGQIIAADPLQTPLKT